MKRHIFILVSFVLAFSARSAAPLTVDSCLSIVMENNISLAAEKLNLSIAEAEIRASKIFEDPTLGVEYANNDDHRMQMGQGIAVELGYTFTPGRRGAAVDLAKSEAELSYELFEDYCRNLRFEAMSAYFEAYKALQLYRLALSFSESMDQIARGDSLGLAIGEIREVDAMSTRIEARLARSEARRALSDYHDSMLNLAVLMGNPRLADEFEPVSDALPMVLPEIDDETLIDEALKRRSDLRAAMKNVDVAAKALTVTRRERNMEFEVALGYNYNTEVKNELAPAPRFSGMTIGVTIPLKFSNLNKGSVNAAKFRQQQAEQQYAQARIEIESDVISALRNYRTTLAQLQSLDAETLIESEKIYNSYLDAYTHGDVSLVELLEVRGNYEEIQKLHVETLCDTSTAFARLMAALGL
ncbi:MAG: TolC family protein [Bacteroides sp.]|nr:TolC family protein [Bacteroides sp.]